MPIIPTFLYKEERTIDFDAWVLREGSEVLIPTPCVRGDVDLEGVADVTSDFESNVSKSL
jgi:hypothetical protein